MQTKWVDDVKKEAADIKKKMDALMKKDNTTGTEYLPIENEAEWTQLETWHLKVVGYQGDLQKDLDEVTRFKKDREAEEKRLETQR
jgi:hypothetical protein